jgi:alcohol dehydrogenase class IV
LTETDEPGARLIVSAQIAVFTFPNPVLFGEDAREALSRELTRLGVSRPLIVTDPGLVRSGLSSQITQHLSGAIVFDQVQPNPTEANVLLGLQRYRESGCDGLIGLGGGSPIDTAKAIRLLVTHVGPLADYDVTKGGMDRISSQLPPLVVLPTTSGTGSEAGRGTLIQLPQTGRKTAILSPFLLPTLAICDPVLTYSLPPVLTAGTGMDAFTHCVESYLSPTYHPICDGIALEGLHHVARGLESAVLDGGNAAARRAMMMGSLLGGISFHKGLGVVHALSHALGSQGRAHHGTLNAILLPHALRFNREAAASRLSELAARLGLGRSGDAIGHFITMTELLLSRLPLARRLREFPDLSHELIPEYARLALLDHCRLTNPRPCEAGDLEDLLDRAW